MNASLKLFLSLGVVTATLLGCATPPPTTATSAIKPTELRLECVVAKADVPNADYIGPYAGVENIVPVKLMAQDTYCSDALKAMHFPRGFVSIYGSSRIREKNAACDARGENCNDTIRAANDAIYADIRNFAHAWTTRYGKQYPIMTGAGPGLMEAGNRGAKEAGGPSVGYTTYYDRSTANDTRKPYGGDPKQALNAYVTHGLIFSSVSIRELAMIKHSAAIVIAPGGTGTEWEIFQIIEIIKSRQLTRVPVYLVGNRQIHWQSLDARLTDMMARKTINKDEVAFLKYVETSAELVKQLSADMRLN